MRIRKAWVLLILLAMPACTQPRAINIPNLPKGITYLKDIDPKGLQSPIWSPDGKKIAAAYIIQPMPDLCMFCDKPRHDIVIIDTSTWTSSIIMREQMGTIRVQAWSSDSSRVAFYTDGGPNGYGEYVIENTNSQPTFLISGDKVLVSPDFEKVAAVGKFEVKITNIHNNEIQEFNLPVSGAFWFFGSWSSDMKQMALIYEGNSNDHFSNIFLLDLSSKQFTRFTNDTDTYKYNPAFSPNGKMIAYRSASSSDINNDKLIISMLDKSCEWVIPVKGIDYPAWSPDGLKMFLIGDDGAYLADLKDLFGGDFPNSCPKGQ